MTLQKGYSMHPRFLFGPTLMMVGLVVLLAFGLWALGPHAADPNAVALENIDVFETDRATFEKSLMKAYHEDFIAQLIGGGVVMCAVFILPLKRGPMFIIAKPALFILGAVVTSFIRGAKADSEDALFKLLIVGTIAISIVSVITYFRRAFPETKYPAHFRWSNPEGRVPLQADDAEAIARLERLRSVASSGNASST